MVESWRRGASHGFLPCFQLGDQEHRMGRFEELGILLGQAKLRGIQLEIISLSVVLKSEG